MIVFFLKKVVMVGKDWWWWWWCGFSLISLFFVLISWICCFQLGLCYLDFDFFVIVWVLISLFWVLISFFWVLGFDFFVLGFGFWFLCSGFIFLSYVFWVLICILLCLRPKITRRIRSVQPMTRATKFDPNIRSATGPFSSHPILSVWVRVRVRSKPDLTRPVDSPK